MLESRCCTFSYEPFPYPTLLLCHIKGIANKTKKNNNQDIDLPLNQTNNIATNREENYGIGDPFTGYQAKKGKKVYADVFAYPLDIDPLQDHLKIKKYKYERTSVQAGRPDRIKTVKGEEIKNKRSRTTGYKDDTQSNVAGDLSLIHI